MGDKLIHPALFQDITPVEALEHLEWFIRNHKLSWPAGEKQRGFAYILIKALLDRERLASGILPDWYDSQPPAE